MPVPLIPDLPTAPSRLQAAPNYAVTADIWAGAIGPWTDKVNILGNYVEQRAIDADTRASNANASKLAAAQSETNAAQSAIDATDNGAEQVGLAAEQVGLATTQANNAAASANSAQVSAAAAGAAAGQPSLVGHGGEALTVKEDETGVEFADIRQKVGDRLVTASQPGALYVKEDGAAYPISSFPELHAVLGPTQKTPPITPVAGIPSGIGGNSNFTAFSRDGVYLSVSRSSAPYLDIYKRTGDSFAPLSSIPSVGNPAQKQAWSADGVYLAIALASSPFVAILKRTGDTFSKLVTPSLGAQAVSNLDWSPDGTHLAFAISGNPDFQQTGVLKRTGDTFAAITSPITSAGLSYNCRYSPDGKYLAFSVTSNPTLVIFSRSGDTYTRLADTTSLAGLIPIDWSPDSKYILSAGGTAPYVQKHKVEGAIITALPLPFTTSALDLVKYFPNGKKLFTYYNNNCSLYDIDSETGAFSNPVSYTTPLPVVTVSIINDTPVYMSDYIATGSTSASPSVFRDGYPFNPFTEFQVPVAADPNGPLPAANVAMKLAIPRSTAYLKAKGRP